ncbi:MAG: hypothetical protein LBS53_14695 [Synergistaceae bacterium]|jgi:hypothetical protein|nr:hypothetical protein [Synergistaceae bacterium]
MKRKHAAIYFAVLGIFALCAGAAFAAMGKVEGFSFTATANKDLAGAGNTAAADGKPDAEFDVKVSGTAGALSAFTLKNLTTKQEWSTASGAQNVLVVTDSKGSVINSSFPKVAFLLLADYKVYVNDRAAIAAAGGEFEVTVKFVDGSTATARATVAAAPTPNNAQAAAQPAAAAAVPAAPAGSGAKLISSAYKGPGGYDLSDGTKKLGSNMNPDHRFDISLAGGDTLIGVRIRATGGGASEKTWDTVATTGNPLVVVTDLGKGTPLNSADGSISISITNLRDLSLWVDGSGDLAKQDFRLTLLFTGGRIEETDIKQAAAQAPARSGDTGPRPGGGAGSRTGGRAIERAVQMSAKPVQIKLDVVGKNRLKKASGTKDFSLVIKVRGQGSIEVISLANQTGKGRWDTIPGSSAWLMLVRTNNSQVNDPKDFSVSIPIKGSDTLELLIEDDGTLAKKDARFLLAVTWDDGEITEELLTW